MQRLFRFFSPAVRVGFSVTLVLLALASVPHLALAAPFVLVDNNGDASGGGCTIIAPNDCSLRSAIQIANTGSNVTIGFLTSYTIVLGSSLPAITAADTTIDAGAFTIKVDGNNAGRPFTISGNRVLINGLRIYGSSAGTSQVYVTGSAVGVKITNNEIGSDSNEGACNLSSNSYGGIYVGSTGGTLAGARVWIYGNTIECNLGSPSEGITLSGTDNVKIGEDAASNAGPAQANTIRTNINGIKMEGGSTFNSVRNSVIFKNSSLGVWINGSNFNVVQESTISSQTSSGVWIDAGSHGNRIGGPAGGPVSAGNVISNNGLDGIYVSDAGTYGNLVFGNRIGTDAAGLAAVPNARNGVMVANGAHDNQVGATNLERNIISGNSSDGVQILSGAHDNLVRGNYIGTNISGTLALPNLNGIAIYEGAQNNLVGDVISGTENLIGGNSIYGIYIAGSDTATNTVSNNGIGWIPDVAANVPNGLDNIILTGGAHDNVIGGLGAPNFINVAGGSGIYVTGAAHDNQILKNYVTGNDKYGVLFDGANTSGNVISRTVIAYNGVTCPACDGIGERNSAGANRWTEIMTYLNSGLGIDKFANSDTTNVIDAPYLYITGVNPGTGLVTGTAGASFLLATVKVELYRLALDPSGYGEGKAFVGSTYTLPDGSWSIVDVGLGGANGPCYTATTTTNDPFTGLTSSEFSRSNCSLFLPVIRR